jgi:hypothetical protein
MAGPRGFHQRREAIGGAMIKCSAGKQQPHHLDPVALRGGNEGCLPLLVHVAPIQLSACTQGFFHACRIAGASGPVQALGR